LAGADNFRLNFSHGTHDDHRARLQIIRDIEKDVSHPIGIIADLQGPKLRVGKFKDGSINLTPGMKIRFDLDSVEGDESRVQLPHPEIIDVAEVGHQLLMDDGKIRMTVAEKGKGSLIMSVNDGSKLSNNKGVNVPNVVLPIRPSPKKIAATCRPRWIWVPTGLHKACQRPDDIAAS